MAKKSLDVSTVKAAAKVIGDALELVKDERDQKGLMYNGKTSPEIINTALELVGNDEDKLVVLEAWAVQEANRVVSLLWRMQDLTPEVEAEYRKLPSLADSAEKYAKLQAKLQKGQDEVQKVQQAWFDRTQELDTFNGVLNGHSVEEIKKNYEEAKGNANQQ